MSSSTKLVIILSAVFLFFPKQSYSQTVSKKFPHETLVSRLKSISNTYHINIAYDTQQLSVIEIEELKTSNYTLEQTLKASLEKTKYTFKKITDKSYSVVLRPKVVSENTSKASGHISGVVVDENGDPIIGASVLIYKTSKGTITDSNGKYSLAVNVGSVSLDVSCLSYQKKIVSDIIVGEDKNTTLNLTLKEMNNLLSDVVVTALGISRQDKALGYSMTKISGVELTEALPQNWSDALSGKVAGLNLVKSNGGPAGSTKIVLRGENSLDGNSEALIVVDGVMISGGSGRMTAMGSSAYNVNGETTVDFGSSLNDINPDDIESISVLKGPGATALYGERGGNGAIIITTKKGSKKNGVGITVNSNVDFETINRWPDYQYEYGQGDEGGELWYSYNQSEDGASTRSTSSAWGPKFSGQMYYQYDPLTQTKGTTRTEWVPYKNNRKDFFNTGITYTNSISIEGGSKDLGIRLGYTNKKNEWIVPNSGFVRNTLALSLNYKVTPKLSIESKINYTNNSSDNLPTIGYGRQTIMYFIRGIVPNSNLDWYKNYWVNDREGLNISRPFSSLIDNPYAIVNEMKNSSERNQLLGNVSATYNFLKNLSLTIRSSLDFSYEERAQVRPFDTQYYRSGMYRTQAITNQERNSDFLLRYNQDLADFKFSAAFGGSSLSNYYNKNEVRADQLIYPGIYTFANSKLVPNTYPYKEKYAVNSLYGLLTLNYKFAYLDLTGRNDWSSTLATATSTNNCSFYYPSANLSIIISEAFKLPEPISYLKLRMSSAKAGSGGRTPYRTTLTYTTATEFNSGLTTSTSIANPELKNLETVSNEVGTDIALFKNKVRLNFTAYSNSTFNQIIPAYLDRSTGYNSVILNAGEVENKGLEADLMVKIIDKPKDGFKWSLNATYTTNHNKLVKLTDDLGVYTIYNSGARGSLVAYPGGSLGALYGLGYKRAPEGSYITNADGSETNVSGKIIYDKNGYAQLSDTTMYIGDVNPKWRGSIGTKLKYKGFGLSVLFDGQFGGIGYSLTTAVLSEEGKLKKTLPGRYNGITGDGVIQNANGTYRINDVMATNVAAYYKSHFDRTNVESNSFSTDYVKLREMRLDYAIPKKLLSKINIQSCTIGFYGRDLLILTNWPAFDPEFGELNGTNISAGFEIAQFPSTRSMGVNLNLSF